MADPGPWLCNLKKLKSIYYVQTLVIANAANLTLEFTYGYISTLTWYVPLQT